MAKTLIAIIISYTTCKNWYCRSQCNHITNIFLNSYTTQIRVTLMLRRSLTHGTLVITLMQKCKEYLLIYRQISVLEECAGYHVYWHGVLMGCLRIYNCNAVPLIRFIMDHLQNTLKIYQCPLQIDVIVFNFISAVLLIWPIRVEIANVLNIGNIVRIDPFSFNTYSFLLLFE